MEIIDAQVHKPKPIYNIEGLGAEVERELALERALASMDAVGVDAAVLHSDDLAWCELAGTLYPKRFCTIATLDNGTPNVVEVLTELRSHAGFLGIRLGLAYPWTGENMERYREGFYDSWMATCERLDLPVCFLLPMHLREAEVIAQRYPNLRVIIDHIGMPPPGATPPALPLSSDMMDTIPDLLALAKYPNVAVKFTGVAALSMEDYPFSDLWRRGCDKILEAFRPERLLWGSDFTRIRGLRTYAELLDFLRYSGEVSANDQETMFGRSARVWFRWPRADGGSAT
jgi:L-fuconolactonase